MSTDRIITVYCRAFGGRRGLHRVMVSADGTVRVCDEVAGYYTTCHSLSRRAQRRAGRLASR